MRCEVSRWRWVSQASGQCQRQEQEQDRRSWLILTQLCCLACIAWPHAGWGSEVTAQRHMQCLAYLGD